MFTLNPESMRSRSRHMPRPSRCLNHRAVTAAAMLGALLLVSACGGSGGSGGEDDDSVDTRADADGDGLIEIRNLTQLDWIRNDLFGNSRHDGNEGNSEGCPASGCFGYELVVDLDFDTNGNGAADAADRYFDYDGDGSNNGWLPIGNMAEPFSADFEGNGHRISNLYIDRTAGDAETAGVDIGLFGNAVGSDFRNLTLDGLATSVTGGGNTGALVGYADRVRFDDIELEVSVVGGGRTGGLVGHMSAARIANVISDSTVAGTDNVGGLAGWLDVVGEFMVLRDSSTAGSVSGSFAVGGLVGLFTDSSLFDNNNTVGIFDSSTSAAIDGETNTGGAVGKAQGDANLLFRLKIENVTTIGDVTASNDNTGGLVGSVGNLVFIGDSVASGNISGEFRIGGLVGHAATNVEIADSIAGGDVSGNSEVGGLVGRCDNPGPSPTQVQIRGSSAHGNVSTVPGSLAQNYTGGLVGRAEGRFRLVDSHSTGAVTSPGDFAGGLIGLARFGVFDTQRNYATGNVTARDYVGGLIGSFNFVSGVSSGGGDDTVLNSFAVGDVIGRNYVGGLVGLSYNVTHDATFATGSVAGNNYVGGLIGDVNETLDVAVVRDSFSAGWVVGANFVGGLIGYNDGASFTANYFATDTSTQANALGFNFPLASLNPAGTLGDTIKILKDPMAPNSNSGGNLLYVGWSTTDWDFGNAVQLPGLRIGPGGGVLRDGNADGVLD